MAALAFPFRTAAAAGAAFFLTAAAPLRLSPSPAPLRPQIAPDPVVEEVDSYIAWRAGEALEPDVRREVSRVVVEESRANSLDPLYVLAVIEVESSFRPDAVSPRKARGLMQLRTVTIRELARRDLVPPQGEEADPVRNVRLGIRYLARLHSRYRDNDRALAAWNAGPSAVDRELAEEGELPVRWVRFARRVQREHRRLRAWLDAGFLPQGSRAEGRRPLARELESRDRRPR
ncbi:MAG: lytic transglycosylase domain-containing protein [Deltaproteobacteria bacterium]|nr:lytic transglycosylase domain-containing protein [Deltaproteobacteria bacterium]